MSMAVSLMDIPVEVGSNEVCCLCSKGKPGEYTIPGHRELVICGPCYGNIPEYIPREQDSEYVLAKIKEKL